MIPTRRATDERRQAGQSRSKYRQRARTVTDDAAEHERICLTVVFLAMATIRLVEAPHDERFIDASNSLRKIASTLDEVPDEMILKLATCNIVSEGTLSCTICDSFIVRWARRCTAKNEWLPRGGGSFAHPLVTFNFLVCDMF